MNLLDLEYPNIDPVAIWLGPLPIRWYSLAYLAGFLLGWWICRRIAHKAYTQSAQRPTKDDVDDFLMWVIVGVILGGRLGYVLFYQFDSYLANPLSIFKVWQGGMSFHGGAAGVIIALIIYPLRKGFNPFRLADLVCSVVPLGLMFGRLANFINGELYGRVTDAPIGMVFPHGGEFSRHPSQLYEAMFEGFVLFIIVQIFMRWRTTREMRGFVSGVFLAGYGIARMVIENFREPDAHLGFVFGHISMGQILSLPMIITGVGLIIFSFFNRQKPA